MALDADTALTTVAHVTEELGITLTSPADDAKIAYIERLIAAASATAMRYLNRGALGFLEAIEETPRGYRWPRIMLKRRPVLEVSEVQIDEQVVLATDYVLTDADAGILDFEAESPDTGRYSQSISTARVADLERRDATRLLVTYTGGWLLPGQTTLLDDVESLPADIQRAVTIACATQYLTRGIDRTITSERLMSESTTYDRTGSAGSGGVPGYPADASALLRPYRRIAQF